MILLDFSSTIHRALATSIKHINPHKENGKYITKEYIHYTIHRIFDELLDLSDNHFKNYDNLVICLDDHSKRYWRKELFGDYKKHRKFGESEINFDEVYKHIDLMYKVIDKYTPWKCFSVPGLEADDLVAILCKRYSPFEDTLIVSPDKDMKQLHKFGKVKQYSHLTNKFIEIGDDSEWLLEHICIGDASDGVPRIIDYTEFKPEFKEFLISKNLNYNEQEFYDLEYEYKIKLISEFIEKEPGMTLLIDAYIKPRFGFATFKKQLKKQSLSEFLNSNLIYKKNYEMNKKLVIAENIPAKLEADCIRRFNESPTKFNMDELKKYLNFYNCRNIITRFENISHKISKKVNLTVDNCGF